jgi:hypothetical protein
MKAYKALQIIQAMPVELRAQLGDIDDIFAYLLPEWSLHDWPEYGEALRAWPEYSGWPYYPVPGPMAPGALPPARANPLWARRNLPLWEGEYGASRQRLLDHLADFFEMVDK